MSKSKPTDVHPALTPERLDTLAKLITQARHETVIRRESEKGDNNWTLGTRAYSWSCYAVTRGSDEHPWLSVIEGGGRIESDSGKVYYWTGLHFVFAVGGVPLRFYRGKPKAVPATSLTMLFPEQDARQTAFAFKEERPHALRLAVETDATGEVTRITLVQVDVTGKIVGDSWPITKAPGNVTRFQQPKKEEGKDLGKPSVGSRKEPKKGRGGEE